MPEFYVYVHRRADTGTVFYVGKGKGRRAWVTQHRNPWWRAVVAKAGAYEIDKVVEHVDEELAHLAEIELIAKLRSSGVRLCNLTDGGEGMTGYVRSAESIEQGASQRRGKPNPAASAYLRGRPKSAEHRAAISRAREGARVSDEARARMSNARRGRPSPMLGKQHKPEAIEKIRQANTGAFNKFFGRKHRPDSLERMSESHTGHRDTDETRARKSAARRGALNPAFGVPVDEARKTKQIASLKARPRVTCPHCARVLDESNAKRWHLGNCKKRTT